MAEQMRGTLAGSDCLSATSFCHWSLVSACPVRLVLRQQPASFSWQIIIPQHITTVFHQLWQ